MKSVQCLAGMAGLVLLLGSNVATATGDNTHLTIAVNTVEQDDSPVQITGIRMPTRVNGHPTVQFQNVSGKKIRSVIFFSPIGNVSEPDAGSPGHHKFYMSGSRPEQQIHMIDPGDSDEDVNQLPSSSFIVTSAILLQSNCVQMTVLVGSVEFADGTKWGISSDRQGVLWRQSLSSDLLQRCSDFVSARNAVARLRGSAFQELGQPVQFEQSSNQHYEYSCRLLKDDKYENAHCPL
jgi:hypothetical protein